MTSVIGSRAQTQTTYGDVTVEQSVPARMRDGVTLYADVYRPATTTDLPVLLMRVPYGKALAQSNVYRHPAWFARQGFMVVIQDTRGRWSSEGEFTPYRDEFADGYDTVEWAAALPRCTGRVGMYGLSYAGSTQLLAALSQPPHLSAIAPAMTSIDFYKYKTYRGGAFALAFSMGWASNLSADAAHKRGDVALEAELYAAHFRKTMWQWYAHLPLNDVPPLRKDLARYYYEWLEHWKYDDYWKEVSVERQLDRLQVPALHVGGWYDMYADSTVRAFRALDDGGNGVNRGEQRIIMGPWSHGPSWTQYVGEADFGDAARPGVNDALVRWYRRWLHGEPDAGDARVQLFLTGENAWRSYDAWPSSSGTRVYLTSAGAANSNAGNGALRASAIDTEPDVFVYNPRNPVPSFGGNTNVDAGRNPVGPFDHRRVEARNDVLVYTSPALLRDVEVVGPVRATIHAASSGTDADFTAKLLDVTADGRALNLADGIRRGSSRESIESPSPIVPGETYAYEIDLGVAGHVFKAGHRIRVEVSSSNFPAYARNPSVFRPPGEYDLADATYATQLVHHDQARPSCVVLPVLGDGAARLSLEGE